MLVLKPARDTEGQEPVSYRVVEQREPGNPIDGIVVGIVTNATPAAQRMTERQYRHLVAACGADVELRFFALPTDVSSSVAPTVADQCYESLDRLWCARLDALIVAGAEPQAASMLDEPSWPIMVRLVDWASDHTVSAIWSCLAAHAAVLKLDGLVRHPFPEKLSGVFECLKVSDHSLVADAPPSWPVPHSRHNDLDEDGLVANGYRILSRAPRVGADAFIKHVNQSLFLFLQGHPEYDPDGLLREYRRDVRRFLAGKREAYPEMPVDYFSRSVMRGLTDLRDRASRMDCSDVSSELDCILQAQPEHTWGSHAVGFFSRWLTYIADQKSRPDRAAQLSEPYALASNG